MTEHILNRVFVLPFGKTKDEQKVKTADAEIVDQDMDIDDMRTEFPNLVRNGNFVQAMEIVQGHGRFNWFYALLDKISRGLFRRK